MLLHQFSGVQKTIKMLHVDVDKQIDVKNTYFISYCMVETMANQIL